MQTELLFKRAAPWCPANDTFALSLSAASDPEDAADEDDLDEELDETGAVTNRSDGKSGTNTAAEPDATKRPSHN